MPYLFIMLIISACRLEFSKQEHISFTLRIKHESNALNVINYYIHSGIYISRFVSASCHFLLYAVF